MVPEALVEFLQVMNPGLILMAGGLVAGFARSVTARAAVMIMSPALALVALLYGPAWAEDWGKASFLGFDLVFYRIDSLSFIFGLAFLIATALTGIYALHRRAPIEDGAALIYAGGAVGATFAGDLISLFVFWEATALASAVLVFVGKAPGARAAGVRYLSFQIASGLFLLGGAALLHAEGAATTFSGMAPYGAQPLVGLLDSQTLAGGLILASFGIKAAFPIVHVWLQDAYPRASETGTVVLSAFSTKLAVYAILRCFAGESLLIWIGAAMTVFPIFFAVIENDLRKVLSYSLNNQVGFMVCAAGLGTSLAVNGAAAHAFVHIIYKALLFMAMGAVLLRTGTTRADDLGGLHRTMPYTTLFCIVGAASISAVPFFSGFAAKSMMIAAVEGQHLMWVWLLLTFASAGVLEHSGIKVPYFAFFAHDSGKRPREAPFNMLFAMGAAAFLCIGIGVSPIWLYDLLPYPDVAREYLHGHLWAPYHVLVQVELLLFAGFAFLLLYRSGFYPPERPGIILDVDWLWRRGPSEAARLTALPARLVVSGYRALAGFLARFDTQDQMRQVFAYGRRVSLGAPLDAGGIWALVALGLVLGVALLS